MNSYLDLDVHIVYIATKVAILKVTFFRVLSYAEIKKTRTTPRNPRANGLVERFNRTLISMIQSYIKGKQPHCDKKFGCLTMAYRSAPQESTKFTPNMIMLGVKLPLQMMFTEPLNSEKMFYLRELLVRSRRKFVSLTSDCSEEPKMCSKD